MKLGQVTKLDKKNKRMSKKFDDDLPIPLLSCESRMFVKENLDRKKHILLFCLRMNKDKIIQQ